MKVKTSELIGPALDWAVAASLWPEHIHKYPAWWFRDYPDGCYLWEALDGGSSAVSAFSPQTQWEQGGPIIERERICLHAALPGGDFCAYYREVIEDDERWFYGPTPLIAAMRCRVARKLGDEIDVPEELLK